MQKGMLEDMTSPLDEMKEHSMKSSLIGKVSSALVVFRN